MIVKLDLILREDQVVQVELRDYVDLNGFKIVNQARIFEVTGHEACHELAGLLVLPRLRDSSLSDD